MEMYDFLNAQQCGWQEACFVPQKASGNLLAGGLFFAVGAARKNAFSSLTASPAVHVSWQPLFRLFIHLSLSPAHYFAMPPHWYIFDIKLISF